MASGRTRAGSGAALACLVAALVYAPQCVAQAPAAAGADAALTFGAAIQAAVEAHPAIRTAAGQAEQAEEGIDAARAGYYPQLSAGVSTRASNGQISGYSDKQVHQASLTVTQMLYDFGKVEGAVGEARGLADAARARALLAADNVSREAASAWIEAHRQEALVEAAQAQLDGVANLKALVEERQAKGATSQSDVAQARSRWEGARSQLLAAQAQAMRWRLALMNVTQRAAPPAIAGDPPAALAQACAAPLEALDTSPPAVLAAESELSAAQAAQQSAKAQTLPTLALEGSMNKALNGASQIPGQPGTSTSLFVNFTAPLYEGGRGRSRERAAAHAAEAAEAAVRYARLSAKQQYQDARAQAEDQLNRLPVLEQRIASTRLTRDLYREQYLQLGTRSLLDLLNAEQEFHSSRFDQVQSEHDLARQRAECLFHTSRFAEVLGISSAALKTEGTHR